MIVKTFPGSSNDFIIVSTVFRAEFLKGIIIRTFGRVKP